VLYAKNQEWLGILYWKCFVGSLETHNIVSTITIDNNTKKFWKAKNLKEQKSYKWLS